MSFVRGMSLSCVLFSAITFARGAAERELSSSTIPGDDTRQVLDRRRDFIEWKRRFDSLDSRFQKLGDKPLSNDQGQLAWGESYRMMAYVEMYEATGDVFYLDKLIERADAVLACRDDRKGLTDEIRSRVMPAWGSTQYSEQKRYCWIVHAGMISYPMARFVMVVRNNAPLQKRYAEKASEYRKRIEETCAAFEEEWRDGPNPDEGYYFGRYLGRHLPLNQQNALGRTLLMLWKVTNREAYRDKVAKLAAFFKNRLRVDEKTGAAVWAYWPALDGPGTGAEDISHAGINVDFACLCFEHGIVFSGTDMERVCNTFLRLVSEGKGVFAARVDGSGEGTYSGQIGRWLRLATVNRGVYPIVADFFRSLQSPGSATDLLAFARLTAIAAAEAAAPRLSGKRTTSQETTVEGK